MRKTTAMMLVLSLLTLALCACNGNTPGGKPEDTTKQEQSQVQSPSSLLDTSPMQEISYYQNPVLTSATPNAWEGYGFGDPFVMRYGGTYYLYVSTKDGHVGVQCWTSRDLVNWTYAGLCATDERTRGAYAPEVYYDNGYFYMYTSPAGNGHYVLRSTQPDRGFEVISDNLGMSIDGSVFIDHNGKWYFYTANHGEMKIYDMTSPTVMQNGRTLLGITVADAWTEGPMTVYHDGYYYITYTGNHVLSRAYRINYGVSSRSPTSFTGKVKENPMLIHTTGDLFGIGHSSTVKGPDLDSYYIVYHSLVNTLPNRSMHVDRIAFNGTDMQILGPHEGAQQVPAMPDVYHYFEAGASLEGWQLTGGFGTVGSGLPLAADSKIVSKSLSDGDFTAEYNVTYIEKGAQAGALFAYVDGQNFGACYFDPASQSLCIEITSGGQVQTYKTALKGSFGKDMRFDCLQSLQIERCGNTYTFYVGDRLAYTLESDALFGGGIGYVTRGGQASFGFIGGTAAVGGRGAADEYHSIGSYSGLIPATHYTLGSFETVKSEGVYAVVAPEGSVLNYRVLAQKSGNYDLALRYAAEQDASVEIFVDGESVATLTLGASNSLREVICRGIGVKRGQHTLSFKVTSGEIKLVEATAPVSTDVPDKTWTFDKEDMMYMYSDGNWDVTGVLRTSRTPACAKRLYGSENWGDYTASVKVTPQDGVNCGLLVRTTNPGAPNFMNQNCTADQAAGGTDWLQGYFVGLTESGVVLGKQNYSYRELAREDGRYAVGQTYLLSAECEGATIRVYVDGALVLEYTDPAPFMQGMIGVRTYRCAATFDDLSIDPIG